MERRNRTKDQNARFHAICSDVAKQKQWAGLWLDTIAFKRLFLDAWARHEGRTQGRIVPSLDGHSIVNLGIQSRRLTIEQMSELIEFAQCWCAQNDVTLPEPTS